MAVAAILAGLTANMIPSQADMLFPTSAVAPPGPLPASARKVSFETPDGATLQGVHIPPAKESSPRLLVLGFGGNAWNASDVAGFLHQLYPEAHVVAFHYRGYRPSTGTPSAAALLGDAPLVRDFAVGQVKPDIIVAAGFSIGSGIAASLARSTPERSWRRATCRSPSSPRSAMPSFGRPGPMPFGKRSETWYSIRPSPGPATTTFTNGRNWSRRCAQRSLK
jgi:pimeloyl-ACP methyl ester carboxylesterase